MDQSLCVIFAVHNAQRMLTKQVGQLLDVLPEITDDFEVMIVDDGSTDDTEEIAVDLSRQFPQVRVVHHDRRRGQGAAVTTGLNHTSSDVVFVCDENTHLSASNLRELWQLRHDQQLVTAHAPNRIRPLDSGVINRLMAWGTALKESARNEDSNGGIQMIRRAAVQMMDNLDATESHLLVDSATKPKHSEALLTAEA